MHELFKHDANPVHANTDMLTSNSDRQENASASIRRQLHHARITNDSKTPPDSHRDIHPMATMRNRRALNL